MVQTLKTVLVTQARLGSTRLPGKVLLSIGEKTLLEMHLNRISGAKLQDKVIVATTVKSDDELIAEKAKEWGYEVYRGSEDDVLDRFYQACKPHQPEWVVRVTSDCPLIDPVIIDATIAFAQLNDADYCANILVEHFPDGQDVEVFKFSCLEEAWRNATLKSDREHVTPYIRNNTDIKGGKLYKGFNVPSPADYSKIRMTVDEPIDFDLIEKLVTDLGTDKTWLEYTNHILEHNLSEINHSILRNEGYQKSVKND